MARGLAEREADDIPMSNIDKQRIAAVRTLEAAGHEEFKTIADARCQLRAMQGGYRAGITWRPINGQAR